MQVDYLIIGQGISGTWLSYYLQQEGKSFIVIDNNDKNAPSRIAAGIINPVTGRRHTTVWMAGEILPFAWNAYNQIGKALGITAISEKNIIDFFPGPQMRLSFMQRVEEKGPYVFAYKKETDFISSFKYEFGYGEIKPVYASHLENILPVWRQQLKNSNALLEEDFHLPDLIVEDKKISYKHITATAIIFCDGTGSSNNPYFKLLPFAPNKGEALTLHIADLDDRFIYKKGMMLVPLADDGHWWIGSAYTWDFENLDPTEEFRNSAVSLLKEWLKMPFTVTGHLSGSRPATLERRPFVGFHPLHPNVGILNGMGTKGCSLAPYFARQLVLNMVHNEPIHADADIKRFSKVLSRKIS